MSFFIRVTAGLLLWACAAPLWGADPAERFLERVPAAACWVAYTGDVAATCAAFQQTDLGAVLCGPAFAPFIAELEKRDLATPLRMRPVFGFDWSELAATREPGGLLAFPLADGTLGAAWLFTPEKAGTDLPRCLQAANDYFAKKGFKRSTAERKGAKLILFQPPADPKTKALPAPKVLFTAPAYYGVASAPAAVDALLAVEPAQSLGKKNPAMGVQDGPADRAAADVSLFLKPFALWELARAGEKDPARIAEEKKAGGGEDPLQAAERLGLTGLKTVTGRLHLTPDNTCQWSFEATMDVERPYRGALRLGELQPGQLPNWPDWIGADLVLASCWGWDFPSALKGLGSLYDQASEPGPDGEGLFEDLLDGLRDDPEGVQVDLRRNLFEQLGPDMVSVDTTPEKTGDAAPPAQSLYVAGVRDVPQVLETLTRFYKDDEHVHFRRAGEYHVWTVDEGRSLFVESESETAVSVRGLALGEGKLVFSTDVASLDKVLEPNKDAPRMAADPGWAKLLKWTGAQRTDQTAMESLLRLERVIGPAYEAGRKPAPPKPPAAKPAAKSAPAAKPSKAPATSKATATNKAGKGDKAAKQNAPARPAAARPDAPAKREAPGVRLARWLLFGSAAADASLPYAAAPPFDVLRAALPPSGMVLSQRGESWTLRYGALGTQEKTP